ncbi:MAG1140 family protein [Mycoplasmopsis hyopharyngis]|uniref:MAG1140 family protein n=1 Tax=Mycoplasmopsis hyopharyngis TaxID=29558 RepID=UPI003873C109
MNKLTKLNKMIWFYILIIIGLSIGLLYFIFTYEIDKNVAVKLEVIEKNEFNVLAENELSYLIKKNQNVILKFNDKYYDLKIKDFSVNKGVLKINFLNTPRDLKLIPNTFINGILSYSKTSIFKELMKF